MSPNGPALPPARTTARARALTDRLSLGSGLRVSPFCLGLVADPEIVVAAFDAGLNFFFVSADMHWPLYEPVREGLRRLLARGSAVREQLVVAVVSYVTQPEFCYAPFYEVLEALPGLGHVDLGVIGGSYASDFMTRLAQYERRPAGMRAIAASFHQREAAATAISHGLLDLAFVRYNAAHAGAEHDLFPRVAAERRTKLFNFKSVSGYVPGARLDELGLPPGKWRPEPHDHYRFALRRPELDGVLCALDSVAQIDALSKLLAGPELTEDEAEYLKTLAALDAGQLTLDDAAPESARPRVESA
jgi:hypothetical protein